jgi:general secretion pathway protein M
MFSDNPVLSRSLAILLLGVVVASAWLLLIAPVIDQRASYKADIDRAQRLIAEFELRREKIGALKREIKALRNDRTRKTAYFTARNATLAAAKLQSRIKALTQAAGARLNSSQVLTTDDTKGELPRVTVRAHMVGSIEAIRSVFHTLESGQPYVFLDNVTVSARPTRRSNRRRRSDTRNDPGQLTVRYEAYGFLWRDNQS